MSKPGDDLSLVKTVLKHERRIKALESALRDLLSGSDDGVMCTSEPHPAAVLRARRVLDGVEG